MSTQHGEKRKFTFLSDEDRQVKWRVEGLPKPHLPKFDMLAVTQLRLMLISTQLVCRIADSERQELNDDYEQTFAQALHDLLSHGSHLPRRVVEIMMDYFGPCTHAETSHHIHDTQNPRSVI